MEGQEVERAWDSTSSFVSNTGQLVAVCLHSLGPSFLICKKRKLDYISLQVSLGLNFYDSMQYLTLKKNLSYMLSHRGEIK